MKVILLNQFSYLSQFTDPLIERETNPLKDREPKAIPNPWRDVKISTSIKDMDEAAVMILSFPPFNSPV